jgi:hypothetical protein
MAVSPKNSEVEHAACPACAGQVQLGEPPALAGEVVCPGCGRRLWFVRVPPAPRLYPVEEVSGRKRRKLPVLLGRIYEDMTAQRGPIPLAFYRDVVVDVLDLADLALMLEEEFGFVTPEPLGTGARAFSEMIDRVIRTPQE